MVSVKQHLWQAPKADMLVGSYRNRDIVIYAYILIKEARYEQIAVLNEGRCNGLSREIQKSDEVWHANLQYKCVLIKENGYHYPKAQQPDGCMDLTTSRNLLSFITRSSHWNCGKQFNVSLESHCTHILVPAGAHTQAPPCCFAA
ncbi:hypothetical protein AcV7_010464 [Taiwanofungus camphoratus]|nr:hypothetical protein AcV7_010464 [Antrodia cinnamomea]